MANGNGTAMLRWIVGAAISVVSIIVIGSGGFFAVQTFGSIDRRLGNIENWQRAASASLSILEAASKKP